MYHADLSLDDPRLVTIEEVFRRHGYSRWSGKGSRNNRTEYSVNYIREYDESDWEKAEFLEPYLPSHEGLTATLREDGVLQVNGKDFTAVRDMYTTWEGRLVLSDHAKRILESAGLVGFSVHEVEIDPDHGSPFNFDRPRATLPLPGSPHWDVRPTIKLPPLSPTMQLTDHKYNPASPGDETIHYKVTERPYNQANLHFRAADLRAMPSFDVARTREQFMITPRTVVSQRFYQTCVQHGLRGYWVPVELEE